MKKKIAILGSTGSIGKNLLKIIEKDKQNFEVVLLTSNKNYLELYKQAKKFKVKNLIINNASSYNKLIKINSTNKIKIYNSYKNYSRIFKKKIDYTMCSISGIDGLIPTYNIIKHTKTIAIANKESIICAWELLLKEIKKNKTRFIPVDSEHFSVWYAIKNNFNKADKIILTASGGPFYKFPLSKFKKINISQALNHPNWKMGKKISVDSATMMNKVFEVIEAKHIFNKNYKNISILIHPNSYVHALIKLKDGMIKIVAHETDMKIPIHNTLYNYQFKEYKSKNININKLNNLKFDKVDKRKFPATRILELLPKTNSLFDTIIVSANDELVRLFLNKRIKFNEISENLLKFVKRKEFYKYKRILPPSIDDILSVNKYIRDRINSYYS